MPKIIVKPSPESVAALGAIDRATEAVARGERKGQIALDPVDLRPVTRMPRKTSTPTSSMPSAAPAIETPAAPAAPAIASAPAAPATTAVPSAAVPTAVPAATIPDKFKGKNAEEIAAAYVELERAFHSKQAPATPAAAAAPVITSEPAVPPASTPASMGALSQEQRQRYMDEFASTGKLSPESEAALQKSGIPVELANAFMHQQQQLVQMTTDALYRSVDADPVKAQAKVREMTEWAAGALNEGQKAAINQGFASGNFAQMQQSMQMLSSLHSQAQGAQGSLAAPVGGTAGAAADRFASMDEFFAAQRDRRYDTDSVYAQSVIDKMIRSRPYWK